MLSTSAVGSQGYDVVGEIVHHGGLLFGGGNNRMQMIDVAPVLYYGIR